MLKVNVWVEKEGRNKTNEVIHARPDKVQVAAFYQAHVVLVHPSSFVSEEDHDVKGSSVTERQDGPVSCRGTDDRCEYAPVNYVRVHGGDGRMSRWLMVSYLAREANEGASYLIGRRMRMASSSL